MAGGHTRAVRWRSTRSAISRGPKGRLIAMSKIQKATHGTTHKTSKARSSHKASTPAKTANAPATNKGWGPSSTASAGKKHHLLRDAAMVAGIGLLLKHTLLKGN